MEKNTHPSFFLYICMGKNHIRLISRMQWSDYLTGFARLSIEALASTCTSYVHQRKKSIIETESIILKNKS